MEEKTRNKFVEIATQVIKTVDEFRSNGTKPEVEDAGSAEKTEPRVNAFYRIIGLPAFTNDASQYDPFNNGNLFRKTDVGEDVAKQMVGEIETRDAGFTKQLDDDVVDNFLDNNIAKVSIGTKKPSESGGRFKGGLFPMAVNGTTSIQPYSRRIAAPFHKKAQKYDKVEYKRPLIELIILLRTKGEGQIDSTLQQELNDDIDEVIGSDIKIDRDNLNFTVIGLIRSLIRIVLSGEGVVDFINHTAENLNKVTNQMSDVFEDPSKTTVSAERQTRRKKTDEERKAELEQQEQQKQEALAVERIRLKLLEYDDTLEKSTTKNMKDAVLASSVLSLLASDSVEIEERDKEDEPKKERVDQLLRAGNQQMDLMLGTYSGLSGIDAMVIITALFVMPLEFLISLLNQDNLKRLQELRPGTEATSTAIESIGVLEATVESIYKTLDKKVVLKEVEIPSGEGEEGK